MKVALALALSLLVGEAHAQQSINVNKATIGALVYNSSGPPAPSASVRGGVKSLAAVVHQYLTSISTAGLPTQAQPSCGDLSDASVMCSSAAASGLTGTVAVANGGTGLATFSTHSLPLATGATTIASKVVPDCTDTGGNHLNFTQGTDAFSCGTSGGGSGSVTSVATSAPLAGGTITTTGTLSITGAAGKVLAGSTPAFTATPTLGVAGATLGTLAMTGDTSGTVTITPQSTAGSPTITLPNASGTVGVSGTSPIVLNSTTGAISCPTCGTSTGTVTSVATSAPLAGGTITNTGTLSITGAAGKVLAGSTPAFTATPTLGVPTSILGTLALAGDTSGTATITPQSTAGTPTITLPNNSGTVAVTASSPIVLNSTTGNLTCPTCSATTGTVTSVATSAPLAGGTITSTGTLSITGAAGQVLAGATPAFTATPTLGVAGASTGTLAMTGATSGTVTITPQTTAGSPTITLPNASGTVAVSATSPLALSATTGALTCSTCGTGSGSVTSVATTGPITGGTITTTGTIAVIGSGGTWTLPVDANYAWVNQGTSTDTVNSDGSISLVAPSSAVDNLRVRVLSVGATPWTVTAFVDITAIGISFTGAGLVWRQSSDGKMVSCAWTAGASSNTFVINKWTSATAFSATYVSRGAAIGPRLWIRITDDGTNRLCQYSQDGLNFVTIHSIGRTDFLTANQAGFYINPTNSTAGQAITVYSWY